MKTAQQLAAPEAVFGAIPELEFDQTENLTAKAGHDRLLYDAGVDAEPIPELEFDQTLGLVTPHRRSNSTCGGAWIGVDQALRGAVSGVGRQIRIVGIVHFLLVTRIKFL